MKRAALIKIREKTINYLAQLLGAFLLLRSVTVFFKAQFEPFLAPISLFSFGLDFLLVNLLAFTLIPILKRCFENAAWLWSCLSIFFASNLLSYVLQAKLDSRQDFLLQLFIFTLLFAYALRQNFRALGAKPKTAPLKAPGSANSNSLVWLLALLITAVLFHLIVNTLYFKYRMNSLLSPAFDYGIFVQAMEGIIRTARPLTSIERGYELSHSAVHFSPILYLLAPVYAIFRTASCLNYLQTIIVLLALIPAYFFMKNSGFKLSLNLVILGLLAFSPFQILSTHYDFHENCFLPLTIFTYLWLKSTKVNPAWDFLAALAILMVKEDAFIYLFSLSLFFLIRAVKNMDFKAVKHEFLLLSFSLFYFILAALYIRSFGLGIMTNRFNNLCRYPQVGILDVLLSFWFRPSLVLTQILHYGKLRYLCMSFICSGFALIWSKRYELWVLAIPLVFVNLLSSWKYQTDIFFQYHQGSQALLLLALAYALQDLDLRAAKKLGQQIVLLISMLGTISLSLLLIGPQLRSSRAFYLEHKAACEKITEALAALPDDSVVYASSYFTVPLAVRQRELYTDTYFKAELMPKIEYIVLDKRFALSGKEGEFPEYFSVDSFELISLEPGLYEIYKRR